jgi:hypothetical protein
MESIAILLELFAILLLLLYVHRSRRLEFYSPILFFPVSFVAIYVSGWGLYSPTAGGASASFYIDPAAGMQFLVELLLCPISFLIGVIVSLRVCRVKYWSYAAAQQGSSGYVGLLCISFAILALSIYVSGNGVSDLFERANYFSESNKTLKIAGTALVIVSTPILGAVFGGNKRKRVRLLAGAVFVLYVLAFVGYSTRILTLALILFSLGWAIVAGSRLSKLILAAMIVLSPYLVSLPLLLRSNQRQGLVPFFEAIGGGGVLFGDLQVWDYLNNLFFVSFPIAEATARVTTISMDYLLISINPLPGGIAGWYDLPSHGLNLATPYSMPGELLNFGLFLALPFYFFIGVIFARFEKMLRKKCSFYLYFAFMCVLYLFSIASTQYTLRSSLRYIYYLSLFSIFLWMMRFFKQAFRRTIMV